MIKIHPDEQKVLTRYVQALTGIYLDASKAYLLESRLGDLLTRHKLSSYSELYYKAKGEGAKTLEREIVSAITTGETSFFRDASLFNLLRNKILPDLIDTQARNLGAKGLIPIRIWSAACSTGQEIYSIAIVLQELLGPDLSRYNVRLLGTDISGEAVSRASQGVFNVSEIERGLSQDQLLRYFHKTGESFRVQDELRAMASFEVQNLMGDLSLLGRFDIIFCRNVAIYFQEADKIRLFQKIASVLMPQGTLVIGSTESLAGSCPQWKPKRYLRSVFYQLS